MYKLNTPPNFLDNMPYYEIRMLYKRLEDLINQEEENRKAESEEYEAQINNQPNNNQPNVPDYSQINNNVNNMMNNIGHMSMDSIGKGFVGI